MKSPKNHSPKKPQPTMWDTEDSSKATSLKNEKRLSEEIGFTLNPGSGNTPWPSLKGDGRSKTYMFECKETQKDKLTIGKAILEKLCREAATAGKDPILVLSMYGLPDPIPKDWVMMPVALFEEE